MKPHPTNYLGGDQALACSPDTAARIDRAVLEYIRTAHDKATQILRDNVTTLHKLAERLMQQETMSGEEFMQLLSEAVDAHMPIGLRLLARTTKSSAPSRIKSRMGRCYLLY